MALEETAAGSAVVASVSVLLNVIMGGVIIYFKDRHAQRAENRREALAEAFKLIDELKERAENAEQAEDRERKTRETIQVRLFRACARVESLEDYLKEKGLPFRPWVDTDSTEHRPLPPGGNP